MSGYSAPFVEMCLRHLPELREGLGLPRPRWSQAEKAGQRVFGGALWEKSAAIAADLDTPRRRRR